MIKVVAVFSLCITWMYLGNNASAQEDITVKVFTTCISSASKEANLRCKFDSALESLYRKDGNEYFLRPNVVRGEQFLPEKVVVRQFASNARSIEAARSESGIDSTVIILDGSSSEAPVLRTVMDGEDRRCRPMMLGDDLVSWRRPPTPCTTFPNLQTWVLQMESIYQDMNVVGP